ncbi:MAG: type IV secretory system conjugative DNA transfer family protein, partial [Eggerthellaceae bacterium]|nr:type IV secretory system conjugative DNA transfer family protein [Eggerthellaceae bacterium]
AGARYEQKVRAAAMTILDKDFPHPRSILLIGKLILDEQFRNRVLEVVKSEYVQQAWRSERAASRGDDYGEVAQWIYSKFDIFDTNATLQQVFGPGKSTIDIEYIMAAGKNLFVKIDESVIGQKVAEFLDRFFTKQEKRATMRRRLQDMDKIKPYFLYFDEFQRFVSEPFAELLSESRKYRVGLVLANQNLRQLVQYSRQNETMSSEVLDSVLANAGTLVAFNPSARDAEVLAPEFDVKPEELRRVPQYSATVRLLSNGRTAKPVVVSMPMVKGPADDGNREWLANRMLEEGIWIDPEKEKAEETKAEAPVPEAEKPMSERERLIKSLLHPQDAVSSPQQADDEPSTLQSLLESTQRRLDDARSQPATKGKGWGDLGKVIDNYELRKAQQALVAVLDQVANQKAQKPLLQVLEQVVQQKTDIQNKKGE